jgi:Arc/MetJ-type ribon-helix-helix transcriptional regulator
MGVPTQAKPVAWPGRAAKRPASGSDARLDKTTLDHLDRLVKRSVFPSRRQAIQIAIEEKPDRIERGRLTRECAKLDRDFEKSLAEEGVSEDLSAWPASKDRLEPLADRLGGELSCCGLSSS